MAVQSHPLYRVGRSVHPTSQGRVEQRTTTMTVQDLDYRLSPRKKKASLQELPRAEMEESANNAKGVAGPAPSPHYKAV